MTTFVLGAQWQLAGKLVSLLAFLGFGTILKGLVNIIHINEETASTLLIYNAVALFCIYIPAILVLWIFKPPLEGFTLVFSLLSFIYWFLSLLVTFYRLNKRFTDAANFGAYVLLMIIAFIGSGYMLKQFLNIFWIYEMCVVGIVSSIFTFTILRILYKTVVDQQVNFIRERLPGFWINKK